MHVSKPKIVERLRGLGRHRDAMRLDLDEENALDATKTAGILEQRGVQASKLVDDAARDPRAGNF